MFNYLFLLAGLILLVISGDYLVKGAADIAKKLKISSLVIGMTVVAFGTSAPEMLVSLQAALKGGSAIAIGNVVGSNIANIGLILGITGLILPIAINPLSIKRDWPLMMLASILALWALLDGEISRWEGCIGILILIGYIIFSIQQDKKGGLSFEPSEYPIWRSLIYIVAACFGLYFGSDLLVKGAIAIAQDLGISERVIGITIVAFGTSVPELAASVAAALKKESDISIGNIIGSNLFNILAVLGVSSAIHPIVSSFSQFESDLYWMIGFALLLLIGMIPWKAYLCGSNKPKKGSRFSGGTLGRASATVLLAGYILYIYLLF